MMMDPEASVSALVFHHPDCAYFTAQDTRVEGEKLEPEEMKTEELKPLPVR